MFAKEYKKLIIKLFHIDRWHLFDFDERPYAVWIVKRINKLNVKGLIVECGCGLGDILAHICCKKKIGYDIDKNVIRGGHFIHPFLKLYEGSFGDINNKKIEVLIAVNFLHVIRPEDIEKIFTSVVEHNDIDRIVVDEISGEAYKYNHEFESLMNSLGYKLEEKSRGFASYKGARRHIMIFKKIFE